MIQTQLGRFADDYERHLRPLGNALGPVLELLASDQDELLRHELLGPLTQATDQVRALLDDVDARRSNLLVFGPQKSGKSTLINALSADYVTRVTTQPSYPCIARLTHSATWSATLSAYLDRREVFADPVSTRVHLQRNQDQLWASMRDAERHGEVFHPERHHPSAVRRIDLALPARTLIGSGLALAEMPGVHGRMPFTYGELAAEFDGEGSCALFVVRSDNPFPALVFEGFEQLLARFSKVFLILNLDSTKRDLGPDGKLVPASHPQDTLPIAKVFEQEALGSALQSAADEGRLRVYPIDLLREASARLQRAGGEPAEEERAASPAPQAESSFELLLEDVRAYLDRDEGTVLYLGDSLRRARALTSRVTGFSRAPSILHLTQRLEHATERHGNQRRRAEALEHLQRISSSEWEWESAFDHLLESLEGALQRRAEELNLAAERKVHDLLEAWFDSGDSLESLEKDGLLPLFSACRKHLSVLARERLTELLERPEAIERLQDSIREDVAAAELDLRSHAVSAVGRVEPVGQLERPQVPSLWPSLAPRTRLGNLLLLRGAHGVRKRLLGPEEAPRLPLSREQKSRSFKTSTRGLLQETIARSFQECSLACARKAANRVFREFASILCQDLAPLLSQEGRRLAGAVTRGRKEVESLARLREALDGLQNAATETEVRLRELALEHGWLEEDLAVHTLRPNPGPRGTVPDDGSEAPMPGPIESAYPS